MSVHLHTIYRTAICRVIHFHTIILMINTDLLCYTMQVVKASTKYWLVLTTRQLMFASIGPRKLFLNKQSQDNGHVHSDTVRERERERERERDRDIDRNREQREGERNIEV